MWGYWTKQTYIGVPTIHPEQTSEAFEPDEDPDPRIDYVKQIWLVPTDHNIWEVL